MAERDLPLGHYFAPPLDYVHAKAKCIDCGQPRSAHEPRSAEPEPAPAHSYAGDLMGRCLIDYCGKTEPEHDAVLRTGLDDGPYLPGRGPRRKRKRPERPKRPEPEPWHPFKHAASEACSSPMADWNPEDCPCICGKLRRDHQADPPAQSQRNAAPEPEELYPCDDCGVLRTKAQGGTIFTVCDTCWDKHWGRKPPSAVDPEDRLGEIAMELCGKGPAEIRAALEAVDLEARNIGAELMAKQVRKTIEQGAGRFSCDDANWIVDRARGLKE